MANIKKLPLFCRCVIQNFPFIEEDFDALTNYELICKVVEYLNKVIASQNEVINLSNELQIAFQQLHDYVANYFDNLDVQEEINNKLDAMVEAGTLQEIITAYIQANTAWCFDNVAAMKTAENFIDGSYAQTLGYHSIGDGGKALYKIRTVTNADVVDEAYIIALSDENLVAELVLTDFITPEILGAYGDNTHDDTTAVQKCMDNSLHHAILSKSYKVTSAITVPTHKIVDGGGEIHSTTTCLKLDGVRRVHISNLKLYSGLHGIHITSTSNYCSYIVIDNIFATGSQEAGTKGLFIEDVNYYLNEGSYRNCYFGDFDYGVYATSEHGSGTQEMSRHQFTEVSTEASVTAGQYIKNGLNFTFNNCRTIETTASKWITEGTCYHLLIIGGDAWFVNVANANFSDNTNGQIVGALRNINTSISSPGRDGYIVKGKVIPAINQINMYRKDLTADTTIAYGDELFTQFRAHATTDISLTLSADLYGGLYKINEFYVRLRSGSGTFRVIIGDYFDKTIPANTGDAKYFRFTYDTLKAEKDWFVEELTLS